MAFNLAPFIKQRFFDTNGDPLAGGFLYTYQAMSSTPQATYTNSGGGTANSNPVELDANGEANIWLDVSLSYKFILKNSLGVEQWTVDNVIGLLENDSVPTAALQDLAVTTAKLAASAVTNAKMASMVQSTIKGRAALAGTGAPVDLTPQQVKDLIYTQGPTIQRFTSGSGTYTLPSNCKWIRVRMVGGGGGGGGSGTGDGGASGNGVDSTFGTLTAGGGVGSNRGNAGGNGGAPSVGYMYGNPGGASAANSSTIAAPGGYGGGSALYGGGGNPGYAAAAGGAGHANTGGGGAGGGIATNSGVTGAGGGGGASILEIIASPSATYSYAVGTGGGAGTAGSSGQNGGAGGTGVIEVEEFYQ